MQNDVKSKLDQVFQAHQQALSAAEQAKVVRRTKEDQAVQDFYQARETIIKPAMQAMGDYLKSNGYAFVISQEDDASSAQRSSGRASITLMFSLTSQTPSRGGSEFPHFSAALYKDSAKVVFGESTISPGKGGYSSGCGEALISELDPNVIQAKIADTIAKAFR